MTATTWDQRLTWLADAVTDEPDDQAGRDLLAELPALLAAAARPRVLRYRVQGVFVLGRTGSLASAVRRAEVGARRSGIACDVFDTVLNRVVHTARRRSTIRPPTEGGTTS